VLYCGCQFGKSCRFGIGSILHLGFNDASAAWSRGPIYFNNKEM
jgi:hypothetical protein